MTATRLLIAASGTGGHLFPAIATATELPDYEIEWMGVPDRLENQLVPEQYRLHTIGVEGFQQRLGLGTIKTLVKFVNAIRQTRRLLRQGQFQGVFTTGGYIAAPAIIAARSLGLPAILHESNAIPGKVTRWLSPWCTKVALGFDVAARYLPKAQTTVVGTPVRSQFLALHHQTDSLEARLEDLPVPPGVPLIVVVGGSQGAVAVNRLVRQCAQAWIDAGAWIVHLTGEQDPDVKAFQHPHYIALPFYHNMAGLLYRADLAVSRAGAGTLTELAIASTPAILIPYPYAAEDHQAYNAAVFTEAGAALTFRQSELTPEFLAAQVLNLLHDAESRQRMSDRALALAVPDSAEKLAQLVRQLLQPA